MTAATSLYEPDGEHFVSTAWTTGPWDPGRSTAARHPR